MILHAGVAVNDLGPNPPITIVLNSEYKQKLNRLRGCLLARWDSLSPHTLPGRCRDPIPVKPASTIPTIDRYKLRDTKRIPVSCQGQHDPPPHSRRGQPEAVLSPTPVILAAAGIQSPDHAPRRLSRLGRAEWTGRRPTWTIPADPRQVGWEKGLWIPAAARMTGDH